MSTLTKAYNQIVDWNANFIGKEYEPIEKNVIQPILELIPNEMEDVDEYSWITYYLGFCPECGCLDSRSTDNMASYPEQYTKTICSSCGFTLGMVDNSPYAAWYQFKDNSFKVEL